MSFTTTNTRRSGSRDQGLDLRSTLGQVTQKAPRRLGQWAASLLFVVMVVGGLVALFQSQSDRVEVLVVTNPVPAGQVVGESDVRPGEVAGVSGAIPAGNIDSVVGKRATAGLVEGQVLTEGALTDKAIPGDGERLVALHLANGRMPGGLEAGDVVDVLVVPVEGANGTPAQLQAPKVLAQNARVESVGKTPEGSRVVTILVEEAVADPVAAYSAAGQVTIVQAPITAAKE